MVAGVLITLAVVLLSPLASANPDGLESSGRDLGFIHTGAIRTLSAHLAGYTVPFLRSISLSKIAAGAIGLAVVAAVIVLLGQGLKAKS